MVVGVIVFGLQFESVRGRTNRRRVRGRIHGAAHKVRRSNLLGMGRKFAALRRIVQIAQRKWVTTFRCGTLRGANGRGGNIVRNSGTHRIHRQLGRRNLVPIRMVRAGSGRRGGTSRKLDFGHKVKIGSLSLVAHRLTALIRTNVPLRRYLGTITRRNRGTGVHDVVVKIHSGIVRNCPLTRDFTSCPRTFSRLFYSVITTNRGSNRLSAILGHLTSCTRGQRGVQDGLRRTVVCPVVLALVTVTIVSFLLTAMMPGVISRFIRVKRKLPAIARVLLTTDGFIMR